MIKKEPKIKIFVAHHKPGYIYEDDVYVPIQVGKKNAKVDLGILGDDTGDNISEKNDNYAELTAQYWVWKNYDLRDVDYVGFCHYRRYMAYNYKYNHLKFWNNYNDKASRFDNLVYIYRYMLGLEIAEMFNKEIITYCSESIKSYIATVSDDICLSKKTPLKPLHNLGLKKKVLRNILYDIIVGNFPEYKTTINKIDGVFFWNGCNIGIMKKEIFLEYSEWLFDILFKFEQEINNKGLYNLCLSEHMVSGSRFMGCLGERLFYLFIYHKELNGLKVSHNSNIIYFKNL